MERLVASREGPDCLTLYDAVFYPSSFSLFIGASHDLYNLKLQYIYSLNSLSDNVLRYQLCQDEGPRKATQETTNTKDQLPKGVVLWSMAHTCTREYGRTRVYENHGELPRVETIESESKRILKKLPNVRALR